MRSDASSPLIDALIELGLSNYKARIYLALLADSPMTGYEISRASGVATARVYSARDRLIERGLIAAIGTDPVTYVPMPIDDFLDSRKAQFTSVFDYVRTKVHEVAAPSGRDLVWHLEGYTILMDRARMIIAESERGLRLSAWREQVLELMPVLQQAEERGVKINAILYDAEGISIGRSASHILNQGIYDHLGSRLLIEADMRSALIMDRSGSGYSGVWVTNAIVAREISNLVHHDIVFNELLSANDEARLEQIRLLEQQNAPRQHHQNDAGDPTRSG